MGRATARACDLDMGHAACGFLAALWPWQSRVQNAERLVRRVQAVIAVSANCVDALPRGPASARSELAVDPHRTVVSANHLELTGARCVVGGTHSAGDGVDLNQPAAANQLQVGSTTK